MEASIESAQPRLSACIRLMFQAMVTRLLAADAIEPAQQELAESHHRFDDAEHRLRGLLAQSVELFALRCPQTPSHGFDRCRVFRRRRRRGKSLAPGGMMRLPPGRNQRL